MFPFVRPTVGRTDTGGRFFMSGKRILAAAACAAAATVAIGAAAPAALALAQHPRAGNYAQLNASGDRIKMAFTLDKGHVSNAIHYDKCVRVPIEMPSISVSNGRFSYDGKRTDVIGQRFKVHVDGKFVTRTKAKGTWTAKQLTGGTCSTTFDYTVTRQSS